MNLEFFGNSLGLASSRRTRQTGGPTVVAAFGMLVTVMLCLEVPAKAAKATDSDPTGAIDPNFLRPELKSKIGGFQFRSDGRGGVLWGAGQGGILNAADGHRLGLVRTDDLGNVDTAFVVGPVFADIGAGAIAGPDGSCYVAANVPHDTDANGVGYTRIYRVRTDGSLDATYRSPAFDRAGRFMAIQPNGKLIVTSGGLGSDGTDGLVGVVRLNVDGTQDRSFSSPVLDDPSGVYTDPIVDSSGRILIAGRFTQVNGANRPGIARLRSDGTLDPTFVPSVLTSAGPWVRGVVLQRDGRVVLGGRRMVLSGDLSTGNKRLIRLMPDGTVDPAFQVQSEVRGSGDNIWILKELSDGRIVVSALGVSRILADGTLDPSFNPPPAALPSFYVTSVNQLLDLPGGRLLVGMGFWAAGSPTPEGVICLNQDGSRNSQFHIPMLQEDLIRNVDMDVQPDGRILISGTFDHLGTNVVPSIIRLLPDGNPDTMLRIAATNHADGFPSMASATNIVSVRDVRSLSDGRFYARIGTGFDELSPHWADVEEVKRFLRDGSPDPSFQWPPTYADSIAVWNDRLIACSSAQALVDGRPPVARLLLDGTMDPGFHPVTNRMGRIIFYEGSSSIDAVVVGSFRVLTVASDGRMLACLSDPPDATKSAPTVFRLVQLRSDGTSNPDFMPRPFTLGIGLGSYSYSVIRNPGTGSFDQVQILHPPVDPFHAVAFLADGGALVSAQPSVFGAPLVRLGQHGQVDGTFSVDIRLSTVERGELRPLVHSILVDERGKIWLTGDFTSANGLPRPGVVRLLADGTVDTSFVPGVEYYPWTGQLTGLASSPDGGIYLLGSFRRSGEIWPHVLTRLLPGSGSLRLTDWRLTAEGVFSFALPSSLSQATVLQSTRDFLTWSNVATNPPGDAPLPFKETAGNRPAQLFYRLAR